ncbi:MAG TPA: GNAT family N-acetyltransferase [Lacipirellulaceae bacterium]|nr:GNAT family N-acetyltransferase [Lacipirellulaceae bacterium]
MTKTPSQASKSRPTITIEVRREDILSPTAQLLIHSLNSELESRYPEEGANFFRLDPDEVAAGRGGFFVAYADGHPVGCGAIRWIDSDAAEIKRMYVARGNRGGGIGGKILAELEAEAARLGIRRIVLETGPRQPEAIAIYKRAGFAEIPLFGEYVDPRYSLCMAKNV